jgi:RNA polymerase sigma factor (sigma-70 family)
VGFLYRVGSSSVRPSKEPPRLAAVHDHREPWIEPALEGSLDALTEPQRIAVVLRHSFEWTYEEIAELLDVSVSTVRNHLARGMDKLRIGLEVSVDG